MSSTIIVWSLGLFRETGRAKTVRVADAPRTAETEDDDAEFVQTGADFSFGDAEETSPIGAGLLQRKVEMQMETEAQLSFTRPCAPIVVAASQRDAAFDVEEELIVPYSSPNAATPGVASSSSLVESDSGIDILRTNVESGPRFESFFASDEDGVSDDDGVIVECHLQEHMVPLTEIAAVQDVLETRVSLRSFQMASL